jgi:hypothetical protein
MTTPRPLLSRVRLFPLAVTVLLCAGCQSTEDSMRCRCDGPCRMTGQGQRGDDYRRDDDRFDQCEERFDQRGHRDDRQPREDRENRDPAADLHRQAREERETNDRVHREIFERLDRLTERITALEQRLGELGGERRPGPRTDRRAERR